MMTASRTPSADPTRASLWAGRLFTALVFMLALLAMADALVGEPGQLAGRLFMAAGVVYLVGAIILYLRRDYILRLFGCSWPFFLPRVDELQHAHRQKAFAATFAVFIGLFSFIVGIQLGSIAVELFRGEDPVGLFPTDPLVQLLALCFVLLTLTLAPQAYLAWTLTPLDGEDPA